MGPDLTGPELVAAACNAGGFGILQAQLCPPPIPAHAAGIAVLRQQIRHLRTLTSRPFGVNFVLHFPHRAGVGVCIEERVAALSFFWGDPAEFVALLHQVGSVDAAMRALEVGIDVIIVQGAEAGGHLAGHIRCGIASPRICWNKMSGYPARHAGSHSIELDVEQAARGRKNGGPLAAPGREQVHPAAGGPADISREFCNHQRVAHAEHGADTVFHHELEWVGQGRLHQWGHGRSAAC
jgi:hypothetical protein